MAAAPIPVPEADRRTANRWRYSPSGSASGQKRSSEGSRDIVATASPERSTRNRASTSRACRRTLRPQPSGSWKVPAGQDSNPRRAAHRSASSRMSAAVSSSWAVAGRTSTAPAAVPVRSTGESDPRAIRAGYRSPVERRVHPGLELRSPDELGRGGDPDRPRRRGLVQAEAAGEPRQRGGGPPVPPAHELHGGGDQQHA